MNKLHYSTEIFYVILFYKKYLPLQLLNWSDIEFNWRRWKKSIWMIIKFDLGIRFWTDMADEDDDSRLLIPIFESNGSSFLKKKNYSKSGLIWSLVNVISLLGNVIILTSKKPGYFCHSVNVIAFGLIQNDHIKRL